MQVGEVICVASMLCLLCAGANWNEFNTAGSWGRKARAQLYGANDMSVGRPSFPQLVLSTLSNPMYLVQVRLL